MKKSTKIILPALALLVLGTTAAATGTVAWFAANGVVSATGMQVKCQTSTNLLITNFDPYNSSNHDLFTEGNNYGSNVVSANDDAAVLEPSSTTADSLKIPSFFIVTSKGSIGAVAGDIKANAVVAAVDNADFGETNYNKYYAAHEFWVANSAIDVMNLSLETLTITGLETNEKITESLRVGYVYEDRTGDSSVLYSGIFAKNSKKTYQGINLAGTVKTATATRALTNTEDKPMTTEVIANTFTATTLGTGIAPTNEAKADPSEYVWSKFTLYVWYEGQDADCTANNALSAENISISFTLKATA